MLLSRNRILIVKVNISQAGRTLLRQRIQQFSEFFCWTLLLSSTTDYGVICVYIPVQSKYWGWLWLCLEGFHNFRWSVCLWIFWPDFFVTCYPFRQIQSTFTKGLFDFLVDFNRFLVCSDWLEEDVHVEVQLDGLNKIFVVYRFIFRHLMQSVICTSRRALRCRVYS